MKNKKAKNKVIDGGHRAPPQPWLDYAPSQPQWFAATLRTGS
jgi:hypothetical protein